MVKNLIQEFTEYWNFKPVRTMFWVRMLSYLTIFFSPFWGMLIAIYFDAWDWDYLQKYKMPKSWYHRIDKVVDYIEYIVLIPLVYLTPIGPAYVFFLVWRTIGTVIYFLGKAKESVFILFPNMAEYIAIFYFMSQLFHFGWNVVSLPWLIGLLIFKTIVELQLHYFKFALPVADKPQPKVALAFSRFNQKLIK